MCETVELLEARHLVEQLAYEEIRHYLSEQFIADPVGFMQQHGKRPEDLNGADLRGFYKRALAEGIQVRQTSPAAFRMKFMEGRMFGEARVRCNHH